MSNHCVMLLTFHTLKQGRLILESQVVRNFPLIYTLDPKLYQIHFVTWSFIWTGPKLLSFMRMTYPWLVYRSWSNHLHYPEMCNLSSGNLLEDPFVKHWLTWKPGTFIPWLWTSNLKAFPHFQLQYVFNRTIHYSKVQLFQLIQSDLILLLLNRFFKSRWTTTSITTILHRL